MSETVFKTLYKKLNPEQKRAVDAIDGPVMIIAGPGTGKTSVLTIRIANILRKTDTSPDSILALTFTESGAYSMRKKLVDIIGADAYKVNIHTFHGFCNGVIESYPEFFPEIIGSDPLSDSEKIKIFERIFKKNLFKHIKPFGDIFFYLSPSIKAIQTLKRENISPLEFRKMLKIEENDILDIADLRHSKGKYRGEIKGIYSGLLRDVEKNKELFVVYKQYEEALRDGRFYDYEDMILKTIETLKSNRDLLRTLQEEFQYILADEHQDANTAQNVILELLSEFHEQPNLFIVGDEKQAIYRFQGASLENFLYFKRKFPKATVISLKQNYRSVQSILDAAHALILGNIKKYQSDYLPLKSYLDIKGENINIHEFTHEEEELLFIAKDIAKKIKDGTKPGDIAILYRDNKDSLPIAAILEERGVPFTLFSDESILEDLSIGKIYDLLKAVVNFGDEALLGKILFYDFLNLNILDIYKIINFSQRNTISIYDTINNNKLLLRAKVQDKAKIKDFYSHFTRWAEIAKNRHLSDSLEEIISDSGLVTHLLSEQNSLNLLEKLDGLINAAKSISLSNKTAKLSDFIDHLHTLKVHNIKLKSGHRFSFDNRVSLMTAHKAKGLEFELVYVVGMLDGKWGNKRGIENFRLPVFSQIDSFQRIDDERRLFYVAITRAKKKIILSYSKIDASGKEKMPSRFLEEMPRNLMSLESPHVQKPKKIFSRKKKIKIDIKDSNYLKRLFLEQGLTVTALNNYLNCPWQYFFENLIRLPKAPQKHQMYGTAIHSAFKEIFKRHKKEGKLSQKNLFEIYKRYLRRQPLSQEDFDEVFERGKTALYGYYRKNSNLWGEEAVFEFSVTGVYLEFSANKNILLRGRLDKVEFLNGANVSVVDFKTGKPRSRREILGLTQNSNGNIKRQLDFYKLLLDEYSEGKYNMIKGEIHFIEPSKSGNYRKESFDMSREDGEKIKTLVLDVAHEIYNLSFWRKTCAVGDCEFCRLRQRMET